MTYGRVGDFVCMTIDTATATMKLTVNGRALDLAITVEDVIKAMSDLQKGE
jgi:hypothetical protein